jgi:hypothetical protein
MHVDNDQAMEDPHLNAKTFMQMVEFLESNAKRYGRLMN